MADKKQPKSRYAGVHIPKPDSIKEFERQLRSALIVPETTGTPRQQAEAAGVRQKAQEHVDWFLHVVRPLMIEQFIHGFKHGLETRCGVCEVPEASAR